MSYLRLRRQSRTAIVAIVITGIACDPRNARTGADSVHDPSVRDTTGVAPATPAATPAPSVAPGEPDAGVTLWLLPPAGKTGPIGPTVSESDLTRQFGADNVSRDDAQIGEGDTKPATVLFAADSLRRLEVFWMDTVARTAPSSVRLDGERSAWTLANGITLGSSLAEVERANGRPFTLTGFNWDYAGTVISWGGGTLDSLPPRVDRVIVRFRPSVTSGVTDEERGQVAGDRDFSSTNPIMRRLGPKVYAIEIWYNESR